MVLSDGFLRLNQNIQTVGNYIEKLEGKERQKIQVNLRKPVGLYT